MWSSESVTKIASSMSHFELVKKISRKLKKKKSSLSSDSLWMILNALVFFVHWFVCCRYFSLYSDLCKSSKNKEKIKIIHEAAHDFQSVKIQFRIYRRN